MVQGRPGKHYGQRNDQTSCLIDPLPEPLLQYRHSEYEER